MQELGRLCKSRRTDDGAGNQQVTAYSAVGYKMRYGVRRSQRQFSGIDKVHGREVLAAWTGKDSRMKECQFCVRPDTVKGG